MKATFSNNLKRYRKQKQLSQEQLAEQLGITTQAVSKWECGLSYPDIDLLPRLADLFCVSIDALLRSGSDCAKAGDGSTGHTTGADQTGTDSRTKTEERISACGNIPFPQPDLPDDNILRIVQYRGKTLLRKDTYDPNIRIPLSLTCEDQTKSFQKKVFISIKSSNTPSVPIEIWGSADIFGDLMGSANIGKSLTCAGDIKGNVNACTYVSCGGDISGSVKAGQNISCGGDIGGNVNVERGDISCGGDIGGDASAGINIDCDGDVGGDASAGGNIVCGDIGGNASAGGSISRN